MANLAHACWEVKMQLRLGIFLHSCLHWQNAFSIRTTSLCIHSERRRQDIEPAYYLPVVPMLLVNGSSGIGTGWSSQIPSYNPVDIIYNIKCMLVGNATRPMVPWFKGFTGTVLPVPNSTKWTVVGCWSWLSATTLRITELPVGTWTNNYKEFLEKALDGYSSFKKDDIKEVKSNYTDTTVHFTVKLSAAAAAKYQTDNELLAKHFKLVTTIDTGNMHAFDADGKMKKYSTVQDILTEFVHERRKMYETRKTWQISELVSKLEKLHNKIRFLTMVTRQELSFQGKPKDVLLSELESCGFPSGSHEYLLGMSIWSMTADKITALQHEYQTQTETLQHLRGTTPEQIWLQDLAAIESEFSVKRASSSSGGPKHKRQRKNNFYL